MKITINKKTWLLSFIILFLPLALSLEMNFRTKYVGYADEIFSLLMLLYLVWLAVNRKLEKSDMTILVILVVFTLIGLISNMLSELIDDIFLIGLDAFWQWKIFVSFLGAKYLSKYDRGGTLLSGLVPFAKLLIVSALFFGLLSFWIDFGMTDGYRYGIPVFSFVFGNQGRYGIIIAVALLIIIVNEKNREKNRAYVIMALVDMILSTKGVVYVIIPIFFLLWFVFSKIEKTGKLKMWIIVSVAIAGVAVSGYQIREYLLDDSAPRALLLRYGFITANNYFPFGSGFGTYGSEVAASHYSPLYVRYGWAQKWSMGIQNGAALNDNYMATIVGECGYVGLLLYLVLLYMVYKQVNSIRMNPQTKALVMSLFICMMVTFLATGITKSSIGVLVFIVLGVMISEAERRSTLNDIAGHVPKEEKA